MSAAAPGAGSSRDRRTLWAELAWLGDPAPAAGVVIGIEGDRVVEVETGVPTPPPSAERRAGLTIPGLANAHSHAFQRALRGRTHAETGSFWTWREQMYALAGRLDPDAYLPLARAAFAEMALAGVTVVGEFHYVHHAPDGTPYADPNAMGTAVIAAAAEAGVRLTLLDTCYLRGGFGEPPAEGQRRFADTDADAWAARVDGLHDGPALRVGAAIHSVRAVDAGAAATVADWSAARDAPLHAHVSEQPAENEACRAATGYTPTALLGEAGAISERFTAIHATHLDPADTAELGRTGARVCLCPTTERDLADGIADTPALRAAGVPLCLGSDSHAVIDLLEEARAVELDERLATGVRGGQSAGDLLTAATAHGCAALGWPDAGRIAPGALADLTTVSLDGVRLAGTRPEDAVAAVVFAGTAADVTDVVVGGRDVVRGRAHVALDVERELAAAIAELGARGGAHSMTTLVVDDIGLLVTNDPEIGERRDAALVVEDGRVTAVESAGAAGDRRLSVGGRCVIPGFVDSHTHLVFAGDRADEFAARMAGAPYAAGGIRVTTEATRAAGTAELLTLARRRRRESLRAGITHVEIKSGYGLDVSGEERCCVVAAELTDDVTFLGAHAVPAEFEGRADDYIELVCGEMLAACAPHSRWIDVFCERGAFDADQSRAVLEAGRKAGLGLRVHANQLGPGAGVQLAVETGAASADHCTYLEDDDIEALAAGDTVATFLPATDFSTREPYPDARRAIDAGVQVALATNTNPGSSYTTSMSFCIALGVRDLHMTAEEAVRAATLGGARALRRDDIGHLAPGARADVTVLDAPSYAHLVYRPGVPLVAATLVGGDCVWTDQDAALAVT